MLMSEQNCLAATGAWTKEQVSWLTAAAKQEARDVSLKLYIELSVQSLIRSAGGLLTDPDTLFGVAKGKFVF